MELPSSEVVSQTPSKPPKVLFCGCIKMEPGTYALHIFNFVLMATFVGLVFLLVVDLYGWFDGKLGIAWYLIFVKVASCLFLIALMTCLISMGIVISIQKHWKCLVAYTRVVIVLNVVVILLIVKVTVARSWDDVYDAIMKRIFIYGGWVFVMLCLGVLFFVVKTEEEQDRIEKALSAMENPPT